MVSATQLSSFLYCPRKLFISKVLLLEEPKKEELIKGTVWHATQEYINKSEEQIVITLKTSDYQEIFDQYRSTFAKFLRAAIIKHKSALAEFNISLFTLFKEYWPSIEEEAKERALKVSSFMKQSGLFGKELWDKLTPKILSEQYFKSTALNLSGIIDVIEVHKHADGTETYVPVELKTGTVPQKGVWDGHRVQIGAYMLLLSDLGKNSPEGIVKYKDSADKRILAMNSMLKEEIIDLISKVSVLLSAFALPDRVDNKNKCMKCPFKDTCYDDSKMDSLVEGVKKKQSVS